MVFKDGTERPYTDFEEVYSEWKLPEGEMWACHVRNYIFCEFNHELAAKMGFNPTEDKDMPKKEDLDHIRQKLQNSKLGVADWKSSIVSRMLC